MIPNAQKFSVAFAFALLLTSKVVSVDMVGSEIENLTNGSEEVTTRARSCSKDGNFRTLVVCNSLTAGAASFGSLTSAHAFITGDLAVAGNETVIGNATIEGDLTVTGNAIVESNLLVAGDETIGGSLLVTGATVLTSLLSLGSPNVLDYGYFYAEAAGNLTQDTNFTTGITVGAGSYTPIAGGVLVPQAGTYLVAYYGVFEAIDIATSVRLLLQADSITIPGTTIALNGNAGQLLPLIGVALVALTAGQTLTLFSSAVTAATEGNAASLSIVRVK